MRPDIEQQIARDWELIRFIYIADADLSARQEETLEHAARLLNRGKPLRRPLRLELRQIRDRLPELVAND